jgi:hypothetical protein
MIVKWIIVALAFVGDVPTNSRIFLLDPDIVKSEADCRAEIEKLAVSAKKHDVDLWAECIEIKRSPPPMRDDGPKGEPGTEQRS